MTNDPTIDGVSRELLERLWRGAVTMGWGSAQQLQDLLEAPVVERQPVPETVPKHKFDTLVQHCKRLDSEIAQARAHVNEITLYQQNAVWFWQHDGEDYLQSLSCPIIIQPHHLRELLESKAQHDPMTAPPAPVAVVLPPFAEKVISKLQRYQECTDDNQGADIGRHWFDLLTQLGLLNRVQRSPALWEITQQGEDCLDATAALNEVKP